MKLCILDNDTLDSAVAPVYGSYGQMLAQLLRQAGADSWEMDFFHTPSDQYPIDFSIYDAVLLTGSRADSFSNDAWVVKLRHVVTGLLDTPIKLLGVCFGHQLIAYCLGAKVDRAPNGWSTGAHRYHFAQDGSSMTLLASHQDQVLELPSGTTLLASSENCPIAAFGQDGKILCIQPHPEFVPDYSAYLLEKRRGALGEDHYQASMQSLKQSHDGLAFAKRMVDFVEAP
ncbi:amidotransferase [Curvibacter sp. CHRR-16]|uniref:glutamine amidotransferase-related protein n=1 Tax=Curvibacter sp. CHRR-16 TaxID=2835872 RepID=UPI001BDB36EC|nr:amidotransferase [Curvibacter sp. CHRR-16]MBT0570275.1 amidotransferase [Curvibacter sp. CHRR-16]